MASQEGGQVDKLNEEPDLEGAAPKSDGQATASYAPAGSGTDTHGPENPGAPGAACDEEAKAAARGSPSVKKASDEPRSGESLPDKTHAHEKTPVSKHAPSKRRSSAASAGKHASKISVSSKAGAARGPSAPSAHGPPSPPTLCAETTKSEGAVSYGERSRSQRYSHAATQDQMTPELFIASPETAPQAGGASDRQDLERGQPTAASSSSSGQELAHGGESGEALDKGQGKEGVEAVAVEEKEKVEEKEGEEEKKAEEKKPAEKKPRKRSARGFKMPDGTYVGLKEKNRYLRQVVVPL
ncbi:uncharacterized protein LOC144129962 [Amblyomma americanum]